MRTILAYLDPGSSSMILQMLLGGIAAVGVALKLYWRRLMRFLRIKKDQPEPAAATPAAQAPASANGAAEPKQPVETGKS
jgi:hypothetical protein